MIFLHSSVNQRGETKYDPCKLCSGRIQLNFTLCLSFSGSQLLLPEYSLEQLSEEKLLNLLVRERQHAFEKCI